jgi:DNA transformation protein
MPTGNPREEFITHLRDELQSIGPVAAKRLFGGYGLFLEGNMFALVADNTLYFKADDKSEHEFLAKDLPRFSYQRGGKTCYLNYYQAPEEALENRDELGFWANKAYAAAVRGIAAKPAKNRKKRGRGKRHA